MSENLTDFGFVTDADALAAILAKKSTGTPLNSRAISMLWDDSAKSKAFFSARVTSADILEGLREQVNRVVSGQVSKEQAVWWMKRFLESKGDSALMDMGFATVEAAKAGDSLAELGSHRRLSLIVDQNVSMARSAREWQQMKEDADIVPFVRYRTREDGSVRNSHALLDRLVFRKDDPALRQIYPPQDFRCRCRMEELDDDDAAGLPIQKGLPDGWEPAKSGYTFDPEQWAAQGLEAKEKWGDDLTKNFEADSMAHGQGRIDALQKNRDIMADLAKTSTDKWQKADAEKAVVSFDERIAQVKADMQAKANQEAKAKAEAEEAKAKAEAELKAKQEAEAKRIEEAKAVHDAKMNADKGQGGAQWFGGRLMPTDIKLGGSTGARMMTTPENEKWVFKGYSGNEAQARNEWIAGEIYRKVGIAVPESRLAMVDGKTGIASKLVEAASTIGQNPALLEKAKSSKDVLDGFVADALLANWDVAGLSNDNVIAKRNGKKYEFIRIDHGGSLLFRAQGSPKGALFGKEVKELDTLRNPAMNPNAASLFAKIADDDIAKQIRKLKKSLTAEDIARIVDDSGMTSPYAEQIKYNLAARLEYLSKWEKDHAKAKKAGAAGAGSSKLITNPNELETSAKKGYDKATEAEKEAMRKYTSSGYTLLNQQAYKGKITQTHKDLDSYLAKQDRYVGWIGRGHSDIINDLPGGWAAIDKWASGEWAYWDNVCYSSASPSPDKEWSKPFKVFIKSKGLSVGGYVGTQSSCPSEQEYLFGRGLKCRVIGVGWNDSKTQAFLLLEEVEDPTKIPEKQSPPPRVSYDDFKKQWKDEYDRAKK